MKDLIIQNLSWNLSTLSIQDVIMNYTVALVLGVLIFISYRYSHSGVVYSNRFNVSLIMLTMVTTLVMNVIGNNVALSLGMVGALSIIRFRTPIKDPRDATYLFWGIAVGICCGVSEYLIAATGSGVIFLLLLIFGTVKNNDRYLLIVHSSRKSSKEVESYVLSTYEGSAVMKVKNTTSDSVEYIYELSRKMLEKTKKRNICITDNLHEIEGVEAVNIISQNEEISR
ncbi:MAG: DUF4956 domain-containing protein [Firmicutes bacterium]|jgi:uncharacterized membrane protein YhiD involved in acid resistance|nr:DUF4956 domain-containing protein [Bacillota bacterium]